MTELRRITREKRFIKKKKQKTKIITDNFHKIRECLKVLNGDAVIKSMQNETT